MHGALEGASQTYAITLEKGLVVVPGIHTWGGGKSLCVEGGGGVAQGLGGAGGELSWGKGLS